MTLHRTRSIAPVAVLCALVATLVAGCSFGSGTSSPSSASSSTQASVRSAAPVTGGLAGYYRQKLQWTRCRDADSCAQLRVPLDYAKPTGRSITLSVLKVPATDPGERIGSMVVNPGGPGESGVDFAAAATGVYGAALRKVYDVVGFDPRGVGASTPVECVSDKQLDTVIESNPDPRTKAQLAYSDGLLRRLAAGCLRNDSGLVRHVSTVEVARDVDILRAAMGDRKLTYFGASYGTAIGAAYADLFPTRVARMVLDGALDPTSSTLDVNLVQAHGFEVALRSYVGACVARGSCFLGPTVDAGVRRIGRFLQGLDDKPMTTSSGRTLSAGDAVYGVWAPLYDKASWPFLDTALQRAFDGDASLLLTLADAYLHRTPDGHFRDNAFQVFNAVTCLDHDDGIPSSQVSRYLPRFEKDSPTFGAIFAYSLAVCDIWPVHSGVTPKPVHAAGSPPIVVVGTTRDPATPLVWAQSLARQLARGVLITRVGDGHTGYHRGSTCVDDAVEGYLVTGAIPKDGLVCR
ncbi:MAG: alpha/beta hydrolase [Nocardioidaceae bacterium]